jgi:hypothetical protein
VTGCLPSELSAPDRVTLGANLLRPREAILRIANLLRVSLAERNQKRQSGHQPAQAFHSRHSHQKSNTDKKLFHRLDFDRNPYLSVLT